MVKLITGFLLFFQQFKVLLKNRFIFFYRNKLVFFSQIFLRFVLLLLIFSMDTFAKKAKEDHDKLRNTTGRISPQEYPILACDQYFLLKTPCYDFVWSWNRSLEIQKIVRGIMSNNPGRRISEDKVKSFHTRDDVDAWLLRNPRHTVGSLHFVKKNNTFISIILIDENLQRGNGLTVPLLDIELAFELAAEREIARSLLKYSTFSWIVGLKAFARIIWPDKSILEKMGPTIFLAITMFCIISQTSGLVTESELNLRQAMSMMGLYESAYWLSWLTWEAMFVFISSLLTILFGKMLRFDFFRFNSFAILFLVFFLFSLSMVAFSFAISNFVRKASSSMIVGHTIFTICVPIVNVKMYELPMKELYIRLMSLFPPYLFSQSLQMLNEAVEPKNNYRGISWSKPGDCGEEECHRIIDDVLIEYMYLIPFWIFMAIYLDNIISNSTGARKSIFYFLKPSYWTGKGSVKIEESSILSLIGLLPEVEAVTPSDDDVLAEETIVKMQAHDNALDPNIAVQIHGLVKVYPGSISISKVKLVRTGDVQAVKGLWINIAKNQLFCLLGPSGAGKTTAINCLTGITPVTGGDALIYGNSIRYTVGMSNIRKLIGVCPQFDRLWDVLSGREHLRLFYTIKGLPPLTIESETEKSLEQVKLASAADDRVGSYSRGMRRRLSIAIALIGGPKLVFMDEPTTGMDPISRRQIWDIIEEAKKGRTIVLTTQSAEEANVLSDRIAIMAMGRLRCLGTKISLKSKFGSGLVATVRFPGNPGDAERVKDFFQDHLNVKPREENKKYATFVIPAEKESVLPNFFTILETLGFSNTRLASMSLEDAYLEMTKQAELEIEH